jgi:hypothetical protein
MLRSSECLLPLGSPTKILYSFLIPSMCKHVPSISSSLI